MRTPSPPTLPGILVLLSTLAACGGDDAATDASADATIDALVDATTDADTDSSTADSAATDGAPTDGSSSDAAGDASASDADAGPPADCFVVRELGSTDIFYGLGVGADGSAATAHWASGGHLGVSTNAGGAAWAPVFTTDDIVTSSTAAVALNPLGHVHVTYGGAHATNASGAWMTFTGRGATALAAAPDGIVHGVTVRTGTELTHVAIDGTTWTPTTIAMHGADQAAITVDPAGRPAIAVIAQNTTTFIYELVLLRLDATGTWSREVVTTDVSRSWGVELVIGPDDAAYILHGTGPGRLVLTRQGTTTTDDDIESAYRHFDVEVEDDGTLHVVWGYFSIGIWHAVLDAGTWRRTQVVDTFLEGGLELSKGPSGEILLTHTSSRTVYQTRVCR